MKLLHTDMDSSLKYIHKRKLICWEEGELEDWAQRPEEDILFTVYLLVWFEFSTMCMYYLTKNNTFKKIMDQSLYYYVVLGSFLTSLSHLFFNFLPEFLEGLNEILGIN